MPEHEKINYLELPAHDLPQIKAFFEQAFAWQFIDYGPDYMAFSGAGLDGGFYHSDKCSTTDSGAALIIFYSRELASTELKIRAAGGSITTEAYDFPGGRRFHFCDPSGNEFAVWSDSNEAQ